MTIKINNGTFEGPSGLSANWDITSLETAEKFLNLQNIEFWSLTKNNGIFTASVSGIQNVHFVAFTLSHYGSWVKGAFI